MEPLFRGPLGPTALGRLARIEEARRRLDLEAGEVLGTVAEAQGHHVEPGAVRFVFDLGAKGYAAFPAQQTGAPPMLVPPAAPPLDGTDQERSA